MYSKFNINENLIKYVNEQESLIRDKYSYIDEICEYNQLKVLKEFID